MTGPAQRLLTPNTEARLMEIARTPVYTKYDYDDQGVQRRT
jgi:hypothetical protein